MKHRQDTAEPRRRGPRSTALVATLLLLAALLSAGLAALGIWQLQRLAWKEALITRINQAQQAAPTPLPASNAWPSISKEQDEYRRVQARGQFIHEKQTLVRASTALGTGYWVMTPLRLSTGGYLLVNRGYVGTGQLTPESRGEPSLGQPDQIVTGLLRPSEPGGSLLQKNEPQAKRWYSRDVAAIAQAQGLPQQDVAPFFIDAVALPDSAPWPRAGLTVLSFNNKHLGYALTWFTLALMVLAAGGYLLWTELRLRRQNPRIQPGSDNLAP